MAASQSSVTVALRFVEGPEDERGGIPSTRVLLVDIDRARGRRTSDLGTYRGVCSHLRADGRTLLRAQCFWVAEGSLLEVIRQRDELVVTHRALDASGAEGSENVVLRLDVPRGAALDVLAPRTQLGATPP